MKLFIGASASDNIPNEIIDDCSHLLEEVLKENDLVFGAYNKGLMGISYRIAKKNNRHITGICPEIYKSSFNSLECNEEVLTSSIIDSTRKIYNNSDIIIMLPGGFGSIYEFFTANYCKICNELNKPIILYNSCGYYNKLISFIEDGINNKIINEKEIGKYFIANNTEDVIKYLNSINSK